MDLILGSVLALMASPVILVCAFGSVVCLRAWPFFVQDRVGQHGRPFKFIKIRTLPKTAPTYGLKPEIREIDLPRFSRFLRERHLDELPQLFLVPLGRMSLVGPRPKMPDEHEPVDPGYAALRTAVPQGCTCLWQVSLATDQLPSDTPEFDYLYLQMASIRLDLWILWRTALKVLGLASPISMSDLPRWARERARSVAGSNESSARTHDHVRILIP